MAYTSAVKVLHIITLSQVGRQCIYTFHAYPVNPFQFLLCGILLKHIQESK